jgi:hypothetical protein
MVAFLPDAVGVVKRKEAVVPYAQMLYGAALSAVVAVVLVAVLGRCRRTSVLLAAGVAALLMPLAWNLILRDTGATGLFSHDLPFRPFPISWQDIGSGVFTLAGAPVLLALGPVRSERPDRVAHWALLAALAALVIDVYTY